MATLRRTDSQDPAFRALVQLLDADLAQRDGADHAFYNNFNTIDTIRYAVIAFEEDQAVGCGAIKAFDSNSMEVKRMYVPPTHRGQGIAAAILQELETWAKELGYHTCVLETGKRQPEAIRLYERSGYQRIPNYGQYAGIDNSVCFQKEL